MRGAGHRDLVLEMTLGHAGIATRALEGQQAAHIGRPQQEFTGIVSLPVRRGQAADLTGDIGRQVVTKIPVFFEQLKISHGFGKDLDHRTKAIQHTQHMSADVLPYFFVQKNPLGLTLGVNDISDS